MLFNHVQIKVKDLKTSQSFYGSLMSILGYSVVHAPYIHPSVASSFISPLIFLLHPRKIQATRLALRQDDAKKAGHLVWLAQN